MVELLTALQKIADATPGVTLATNTKHFTWSALTDGTFGVITQRYHWHLYCANDVKLLNQEGKPVWEESTDFPTYVLEIHEIEGGEVYSPTELTKELSQIDEKAVVHTLVWQDTDIVTTHQVLGALMAQLYDVDGV